MATTASRQLFDTHTNVWFGFNFIEFSYTVTSCGNSNVTVK